MPFAKFIRVSKIVDTFRTSSIKGQFDIPNMEEVKTEFNVNLPCALSKDKNWKLIRQGYTHKDNNARLTKTGSFGRLTCTFKYIKKD